MNQFDVHVAAVELAEAFGDPFLVKYSSQRMDSGALNAQSRTR